MKRQKIGEVRVSRAEIKRIIERGPEAMAKDVKNFSQNCIRLFERMQDLYVKSLPAQLAGVKVQLIISTDKGTLFDAVFGSTPPCSDREEAEREFKEMKL